jgi:hypothetical protein
LSRQVSLGQVRRRAAQYLVLMLQQLDPPPRLAQLDRLAPAYTRLWRLRDLGLTSHLNSVIG